MKTFLMVVLLVIASVAVANELPVVDTRVELGKYSNDPFVEEGLLWFPYDNSWTNSMDKCECVQYSTVTNLCISRRCWHIVLRPDGTIEKTLHLHGAK